MAGYHSEIELLAIQINELIFQVNQNSILTSKEKYWAIKQLKAILKKI